MRLELSHHLAITGLACSVVIAAPLRAQDVVPVSQVARSLSVAPRESPSPGTLVVYFKGGAVDKNIAAVVATFLDNPILIASETYEVRDGDTICGLLKARGLPGGCDYYLDAVRKLNPQLKGDAALHVGQRLQLPVLDLRVRRITRGLPTDGASLSQLIQRWSAARATAPASGDASLVEFDSIELRVRTKDQSQLESAQEALVKLKLLNTSFQPIPFTAHDAAAYSVGIEAVRTACTRESLQGQPVDYFGYAFEDIPVTRPSGSGSIHPVVYILDVPLLGSPNLRDDSAAASGWRCEWFDYNRASHATHMAGIIASRQTFGFEGLEPTASVKEIPYLIVPTTSAATNLQKDPQVLYDYNDLFRHPPDIGGSIPVFLVASTFYGPSEFVGLATGHLPSPDARFNGQFSEISDSIKQGRPLLIVAAGQDPAQQLDNTLPMVPQNLGDLPNVVVVTACSYCARHGGRLLDAANYDNGRRLVHIAAPGGAPLPGWVNREGIGAFEGTSQAAAYAAGVAAEMIARFPMQYSSAAAVKERLQVTSWPLLTPDDKLSTEASKLSGGLVDPELAAYDPSKDWVKTLAGWSPVTIRDWSSDVATFRRNGKDSPRDLSSIKRLIHGSDRYLIYWDRSDLPDLDEPDSEGIIKIVDAGTLQSSGDAIPKLVLCDGTRISLTDILDLIPNLRGIPSTSERQNLRCAGN